MVLTQSKMTFEVHNQTLYFKNRRRLTILDLKVSSKITPRSETWSKFLTLSLSLQQTLLYASSASCEQGWFVPLCTSPQPLS